MVAQIKVRAVINKDRQLVVVLPANAPIGPVELVIQPLPAPLTNEREIFRAKLRAAGLLAEGPFAPPDAVPLSDEERERLGRLFAGEKSVDELVDEDRGLY